MNYTEYTVWISTDPSYYGLGCTQHADRIAEDISQIIMIEFPGIRIIRESEIRGRGVSGPDSQTVEDIGQWVEDNWTSAL